MTRLDDLNLIRLFDFYLAAMFLIGLFRRWRVYFDSVLLAIAIRTRWPRLLQRLKQHHTVLLNWQTVQSVTLALALTVIQMIASRLIWPRAKMVVHDLYDPWWQIALLIVAITPMLLIDIYFLVRIGTFDRGSTEKYFDQAENWAGTWKARLVRVVTFGKIDPNRMVDDEIKKGLKLLGENVNWSMWWVTYQISARLFSGLVIWSLWAIQN